MCATIKKAVAPMPEHVESFADDDVTLRYCGEQSERM